MQKIQNYDLVGLVRAEKGVFGPGFSRNGLFSRALAEEVRTWAEKTFLVSSRPKSPFWSGVGRKVPWAHLFTLMVDRSCMAPLFGLR